MDMELIAWVSGVWFLVSVIVSLAAGRTFQHASTNEAELEQAASRKKVVRYLRDSKAHAPKIAKPHAPTRRSATV